MALPTRRISRRSLTASATKLGSRETVYSKRLTMPWQLRAFEHYDRIGELRYACHFYSKQLSRVIFYPARLRDDGTTEPIREGLPVQLLNRIQDPGGGRSQLQYRYGLLMFITGEGVLFGTYSEPEVWKFLWKDEVKRLDNGEFVRLDYNKQETGERGTAYRMWTPHPRHSDEADSPMRAISDVAEELIILTASVRGTATTRLTNGIIFMPQELSPNPLEVGSDEDPQQNIFLDDYIEHITAQIEHPGAPESKVPFLLEGSYEYGDRLQWIKTHDPATDYMEKDLRKEAIERLALGLDMPPEALLGMTDANHWTAKQVQHDIWRSHGAPRAEQFADDIAEAYLRPALRDEEFADWEDVVIAYDDSQVVISPDRTDDADKALDRIAISFEGYRTLKGIPEDMAPSEEEKEFLASLKLRQPIELENGDLVIPQRGPVAQQNGNAPEEGPPEPSAGRTGSRQEARTASGRIQGAAEAAVMRCRILAGVRIRHKDKTAAEGTPDSLVASVIGPGKHDPMDLVRGGSVDFRALLDDWGYERSQADVLCQMLEVYAAKTLYEPRQPELPQGFIAQVEKAREMSNALVSPSA